MTCIWASKVQSNPVVGVGPVPETRHHSGRSIKLVAVSDRSQYVWTTSRQRAVLAHHVTGRAALSAQSRSTKTRAIGHKLGQSRLNIWLDFMASTGTNGDGPMTFQSCASFRRTGSGNFRVSPWSKLSCHLYQQIPHKTCIALIPAFF